MLLRIRTRDGTERLTVQDNSTIKELQVLIEQSLKVPVADQRLSLLQGLLMSKNPDAFTDMKDSGKTLRGLGVQNGDLVYLAYSVEREPTVATKIEKRPFGAKMTVEDMIAKQTRIEAQDKAHCAGCSFDAKAADTFQSYVRDTLGFQVPRMGFLYGECSDEGEVKVNFIYEPPQECPQDHKDGVILMRDEHEELCVNTIAANLGMQRVGIVIAHANPEREYTVSAQQLALMAEFQAEGGQYFCTAAVSLIEPDEDDDEDEQPQVHFDCWQCSEQCVKLYKDGWFTDANIEKPERLQLNKDVVVHEEDRVRDSREVDNDFLLVAVPITSHEGPLKCTFPVENRLITATGEDLKRHVSAPGSYTDRLSDFHLLLFLSQTLDLNTDLALIADSVRTKGEIQEGYRLIIDSIAGL